MLGRIVGVRNGSRRASVAFRLPLVCAARALGKFPLVLEQMFEETVASFRGSAAPGDFQAAGYCVACDTGGIGARPAEALLFDRRAFGLFTEMRTGSGTVGFPEAVTARDQRDGFFVFHGHALK